jgi:FMN-dependent dehydrogenase
MSSNGSSRISCPGDAHMRDLSSCHSIEDLRRAATRRSHKMVFDYIDGGADDEVSLRRNAGSFDELELSGFVTNSAPIVGVAG